MFPTLWVEAGLWLVRILRHVTWQLSCWGSRRRFGQCRVDLRLIFVSQIKLTRDRKLGKLFFYSKLFIALINNFRPDIDQWSVHNSSQWLFYSSASFSKFDYNNMKRNENRKFIFLQASSWHVMKILRNGSPRKFNHYDKFWNC